MSLASWLVSRGRLGCLDIDQRGLLARLVIIGDAAKTFSLRGLLCRDASFFENSSF
jgi:hypothetical protein